MTVKVRDWLAWWEILGVVGLFKDKHRSFNPKAAVTSNPLFASCPWLTKKHNATRDQFVLMNKDNIKKEYLVSTKLELKEPCQRYSKECDDVQHKENSNA